MSDDSGQQKTEQPTHRRLTEARKKGQVAVSKELTSGMALLAGALTLKFKGAESAQLMIQFLNDQLMASGAQQATPQSITLLATSTIMQFALITALLAMVPVGLSLATSTLQTGFLWTTEPLVPDPSRLIPSKGFSKLISVRALVRGVTTVLIASCVLGIAGWFIARRMSTMDFSRGWTTTHLVRWTWDTSMFLAVAIGATLTAIGIAEYLYQRWQHTQDLLMTKQEVRDEYKREEGDPLLKGRVRKLQREMSQQKRMLAEVPDATMVVRNPTHYAVALKYDRDNMAAPLVVASGADAVALRIIDCAEKHGVPVIENRPLARAIFAMVPVGGEIPYELFQAVAEILAQVYRLERKQKRAA